jgi:hypothetical protein
VSVRPRAFKPASVFRRHQCKGRSQGVSYGETAERARSASPVTARHGLPAQQSFFKLLARCWTPELDLGVEIAGIRFQRNGSLTAATAVRRLQRNGLRIFLTSERSADATTSLASRLGVERHCGEMRLDDKIRLLRELSRNRVATVFVGDCVAGARAAQEAHLAISFGGGYSGGREPWDVALLGPSIELLPTLFVLSRDHTTRIERARHTVMAPNLLCVAGAFSFGLTGLPAVFISNFGTSIVYNNVTRSLRAVDDPVTQWRDTCWFEDAATASDWPNSRLGEGYDMEIHHDQPAA